MNLTVYIVDRAFRITFYDYVYILNTTYTYWRRPLAVLARF